MRMNGPQGFLSFLVCVLSCALPCLLPVGVLAQESPPPCPKPPDYKYLRFDEDYSYLRNPGCRTDFFDNAKFISLKPAGKWYISLGAETRQTTEYFINSAWGRPPQSPAYSLERYMAHADFHLGGRFRFFVQVKSGLEFNRVPGPRVFDRDEFDIENGFFDFGLLRAPSYSLTLRAGRQELAFGATRWVSAREGPTVRQTFDGFRLLLTAGAWRFDAFATKPVKTNTGVLDDAPDPTKSFWGAYTVRPFAVLPGGNIDLYYFGLDQKLVTYNQGAAPERRHTIGTRLWGKHNAWDYDEEALFQFGTFGSGDIRAWALETDTGFTLGSLPATPRIELKADISSGDKNLSNPNLQTFNPLFPRGIYDQLVNLVGHVNFIDALPVVTFHPVKSLSFAPECEFIWRESLQDGVYGVGGNLIRPVLNNSRARYVGTQPTLTTIWQANRHFSVVGIYTHFLPGPFIRQTGVAQNVDYFSGWIDFKF